MRDRSVGNVYCYQAYSAEKGPAKTYCLDKFNRLVKRSVTCATHLSSKKLKTAESILEVDPSFSSRQINRNISSIQISKLSPLSFQTNKTVLNENYLTLVEQYMPL